jgi:hypothetical protein
LCSREDLEFAGGGGQLMFFFPLSGMTHFDK